MIRMIIRYKVDRALGDDEYTGRATVDDGDGGTQPFENMPWPDFLDLITSMAQDCVPDEIYVQVGSARRRQLSDDKVMQLTTGEWHLGDSLTGD